MAISKACYDIETSCDYDSGVEKYMQLCSSFLFVLYAEQVKMMLPFTLKIKTGKRSKKKTLTQSSAWAVRTKCGKGIMFHLHRAKAHCQ